MKNRQEEIKRKNLLSSFSAYDKVEPNSVVPMESRDLNFEKIKIGNKMVEDIIAELGVYKKVNSNLANKEYVLEAISAYNFPQMREISNFFFEVSGLYKRLCRYMAYLYRYD